MHLSPLVERQGATRKQLQGGVTWEQKFAGSRVQNQIMGWAAIIDDATHRKFDVVPHFRSWKEMHGKYFIQAVEAHVQP